MANKSPQSKAKQAVKKAAKKNPKGFIIAVIAIVLIIAIAVAIVYFAFPDTWNNIVSLINSNLSNSENETSNNSNNKNIDSGLVFSDGELLVEYVDVEQGDCQIIIFPDGKTMMIDGGDRGFGDEIASAMDELNITKLDYVLLTHTDSDHCGSLDDAINHATYVENIYLPKIKSSDYNLGLSNDYPTVETVVYNDFVKASKEAIYLDSSNQQQSANIIFTEDIITIEDTAKTYKFTMYCRSDNYYKTAISTKPTAHQLNDVSPISVLEFNGRILLFAGDANNSSIDTSSEGNFLAQMQKLGYSDETFDADILKVPHHGGKDSSGSDFLNFIDVEYAIVCVGGTQDSTVENRIEYALFINETLAVSGDYNIIENKKYGHPTHEVCAEGGRLDESGVQNVYYTWFNGNIKCKIDKNGEISFSCAKVASIDNNIISFN